MKIEVVRVALMHFPVVLDFWSADFRLERHHFSFDLEKRTVVVQCLLYESFLS